MKCTYNIFLEALRGQIRRYLEVEVAMIYYKFVGTPTSRGHVQFPTWKFSSLALRCSSHHLDHPPCLHLLKRPWCIVTLPPPPRQPCTSELDLEVHRPSFSICVCGSQPTRCTAHTGMSRPHPLHYSPLTALIHLAPLPTLVSKQVF